MTDMTLSLASVLTDAAARAILEQVAASRLIRFGDLVEKATRSQVSRDTAKATIRKLQDFHLVDVRSSGLEDLNLVFITADGLEASRKISG